MKKPTSLNKFKNYPTSMDFRALRKEGQEILENTCGEVWTDFNEHDPGITILENIIYAINELGYKANFDIEDLFFSEDKNINNPETIQSLTLFEPEDIYPNSPWTTMDYRKLIVDRIPEVKNAWCEPTLTSQLGLNILGLYKVYLQLEGDASPDEAIQKTQKLLSSNRNLCEDFDEIIVLKPQHIEIAAIVRIDPDAIGESVISEIYHRLSQSLTPSYSFHNLEELQDLGLNLAQAYEGPSPQSGFLLDAELIKSSREKISRLYRSNLIRVITKTPGVQSVRNFVIYIDGKPIHDEYLEFDPEYFPYLDVSNCIQKNHIQLIGNEMEYDVSTEVIEYLLDSLKSQAEKHHKRVLKRDKREFQSLHSKEEIAYYLSLQNTFPKTYNITSFGIHGKETTENKAKAIQLKGYLLPVEQIITNFLSQLVNARNLFSLEKLKQSYFYQNLDTVPGIESLIGAWSEFEKKNQDLIKKYDNALERQSRFLDHLLARFGEDYLTDLASNIYKHSNAYNERKFLEKTVDSKIKLLKNYPAISSRRAQGDEFSEDSYNSAIKQKLQYLFNINQPQSSTTAYMEAQKVDIQKAKKRGKSQKSEYAFYSSRPDLLAQILAFGVDLNHYTIEKTSSKPVEFTIFFSPTNSKEKIDIYSAPNIEDCEESLQHLIQKLHSLNTNSEGFHLVEHVLLRPQQVHIRHSLLGTSGILLHGNIQTDDVEKTKEGFIRKLVEFGKLKKNYKVIKNGDKYTCQLLENKKLIAQNETFVQKKTAEDHIAKCIEICRNLEQDPRSSIQYIISTEVPKKGMDLDDDPYSGIMTVVAPKFTGRFQSKKSQKMFELALKENAPAHIQLQIAWLDFHEMKDFESVYTPWRSSHSEQTISGKKDDLGFAMLSVIENIKQNSPILDTEIKAILKTYA